MTRRDLTTTEAARLCGLFGPHVIRRAIDLGQLKGYRIPGSTFRRVSAAELRRWVEACGAPVSDALREATEGRTVESEWPE